MLSYRSKIYFGITFLVLLFFANAFLFSQENRPSVPKNIPPSAAKSGAYIDINVPPYPESNFTPTQLVTDVLVGSSPTCGTPQISNVTISPNQPVTNQDRFWGYFNKATTQFPFDEGIILSTGYARRGGNQAEANVLGDVTGTASDADLVAAINATQTLYNAVALEFDFVPASTQMKFNYIFASEEYTGGFPCSGYEDAFALLLKPNTAGSTYTNLAVLPGGAGPVTATNIVPASFSCGPINAQYFGSLPPNQTNYYGRTIPLQAIATVTPGQSYHIKMVLADARDSSYDSAVFLEAGSFDIGVQILGPTGVALPASVNMCDLTPQTMTASVQVPGATYQWFLNGTANPIAGATNPTYIATQPGVYTVQVNVPGNQCPGEASITIVGGTSPVVNNVTFTQCYGPGNVNFNLPLTQTAITSTPGVSFAYYETLADAQAQNGNTITNPNNYSSAGNQTVYALVLSTFCPKIAEIHLVKAPQLEVDIATPPAITCTTPQVILNATSSIYPTTGATFHWVATNGGYIFSGTDTLTPTVASGGTYTLTISQAFQPGDILCTAVGSVNVQQDITPPSVTVSASDTKICAGQPVTLTATGGTNYVWSHSSSNSSTVTLYPNQTTTYTVYAVGDNGCQSTNPATVTVEVIPAIVNPLPAISGQICLGDSTTLNAGTGPNFTYSWYQIVNNTNVSLGNTQTISVNELGTYYVTIDNGECSETFSTEVIQAQIPQIVNADYQTGTLTLTAYNPSNGTLEYSIDNGFTWQDSNVFQNVPANVLMNFLVRVKNTSCTGNLDFFTLHILNIITPNGDGVNDVLDLSGISRYNDFAASVYDRYGRRIWNATKNEPIWNGRFQGRLLSTGTYWYQINYQDPANKKNVEKSGWIVLKNRE